MLYCSLLRKLEVVHLCVFVRTYASVVSYLSTFLCCFQYWRWSHVCTCYIYLEPARNWWDPHTHTAEQHHGRSRAALVRSYLLFHSWFKKIIFAKIQVYAPNMASGSYWYSCQQTRWRSGCSQAISNTISYAGETTFTFSLCTYETFITKGN